MPRWGFPALVVSAGLHGALIGAGLLSGLQARAARQPELLASMAVAGSSVEVEATTESFSPATAPANAEDAVEPERTVSVGSAPPLRVSGLSKPQPAPAMQAERPQTRVPPRVAPRRAVSPAGAIAPVSSANAVAGVFPSGNAVDLASQGWPARAVMSLGYGVARAVSLAAPPDAEWGDLPVGQVGTIRVELSVDERRSLTRAQILRTKPDDPPAPAALEHLFERALLLMRGGQFVSSASHGPGVEQLVIDVAIRAPASNGGGSEAVVEKAFSGATPARPGKAYFRYGSGRKVEATVTILRDDP